MAVTPAEAKQVGRSPVRPEPLGSRPQGSGPSAGSGASSPAHGVRVAALAALAALVVGTVLRSAAPVLGVLGVAGSAGAVGDSTPTGASLAAAALAPLLLAGVVGLLRSPAAVAAAATLAPGLLLADLALLLTPDAAQRPELAAPAGLAASTPSTGTALLLVGDLLVLVAGVLAFVGMRQDMAARPAAADGDLTRTDRGRPVLPVAGALLAVIGLAAAPFSAVSGGFDPRGALDTPAPAGPAAGLLALGALVTAFVAGSSSASATDGPGSGSGAVRPRVAALGGLAAALAAYAVPTLVASLATPGLGPSAGPPLILLGAGVVALAALLTPTGAISAPARRGDSPVAPGRSWLGGRLPGVLALLAALFAAVGALAPTLSIPPGLVVAPDVLDAGPLLLPAAAVLAVPGMVVLVGTRRLVARVRPVLSVVWAAVPLASGAVVDVVLAGVDAGDRPAGVGTSVVDGAGVSVAPGGWAVVVALVLAVATVATAVAAGVAERRDVGDPGPADPDHRMLPLAAVAAVLAVPGFGGPLARDALGTTGGPWQDASAASWGSLAALVGVVVAVLLAPRARPPRALALLGGAAGLLLVRLTALLLAPPGTGEHVGVGTYAAAGCLLAVLAAAVVAVRAARETRATWSGRSSSPGVSGVAPTAGSASIPRG